MPFNDRTFQRGFQLSMMSLIGLCLGISSTPGRYDEQGVRIVDQWRYPAFMVSIMCLFNFFTFLRADPAASSWMERITAFGVALGIVRVLENGYETPETGYERVLLYVLMIPALAIAAGWNIERLTNPAAQHATDPVAPPEHMDPHQPHQD